MCAGFFRVTMSNAAKDARAPRANSREKILDAAERLVAQSGVASLTYDALARSTGISRGGILHNFKSKDDLVAAMVDRLMVRFDSAERNERGDDISPLEAYLKGGLKSSSEDLTLSSVLLTAAMNDPSRLKQIQAQFRSGLTRFMDEPGLDGVILALASDALILLDVLRLTPFTGDERESIARRILENARSLEAKRSETP
jgi:AcrR family transcriptional regulator